MPAETFCGTCEGGVVTGRRIVELTGSGESHIFEHWL